MKYTKRLNKALQAEALELFRALYSNRLEELPGVESSNQVESALGIDHWNSPYWEVKAVAWAKNTFVNESGLNNAKG